MAALNSSFEPFPPFSPVYEDFNDGILSAASTHAWFRNPWLCNMPPWRIRWCTSARDWKTTLWSGFWESAGHPVHPRSRACGGTWGRRHRWRQRWWKGWRRTPACRGPRGSTGPLPGDRLQRWTRPLRCPETRSQHCCPSHCRWRRQRTDPGWLPPY